jgi:ubiquinone/menaquinone biosynthesis C-methylase UbiE
MKSPQGNFPYLHGFSKEEQDRLIRQAEYGEFPIFSRVNFTQVSQLLEVGCGVGAQSEILLRRFPKLKITGIDMSDRQLATLKERQAKIPMLAERMTAMKMDATKLKFKAASFDGAFLCWILEHIPEPGRVLKEVQRVLQPGSPIVVTECMNASFFLDPYSPHVWKFWMAYNDHQIDSKGDPFVGAKLGNLLTDAGFHDIVTEVKTWYYDKRYPVQRKECLEYWTDLLLSAAPQLITAKLVTEADLKMVKKELASVAKDPNAVFFDSFIQARAIR